MVPMQVGGLLVAQTGALPQINPPGRRQTQMRSSVRRNIHTVAALDGPPSAPWARTGGPPPCSLGVPAWSAARPPMGRTGKLRRVRRRILRRGRARGQMYRQRPEPSTEAPPRPASGERRASIPRGPIRGHQRGARRPSPCRRRGGTGGHPEVMREAVRHDGRRRSSRRLRVRRWGRGE